METIESKRLIVAENEGTYAVDVWTRTGTTYFAQAQQLYVGEYRAAHATGDNEQNAIKEAVDKLIEKYQK